MKILIICLVMLFISCDQKQSLTIDHIINEYKNVYEIYDEDIPFYQMINAKNGVLFYVDRSVVKIYEYKNKKEYEQACKDYSFIKDFAVNGLFICESSDKEFLDFFVDIR